MRVTIHLATENAGKIREMKAILAAALPGIAIKSMADLDAAARAKYSANETGTTYAENALIKARALSQLVDGIVIADDSGFEVENLGGEPGVYSARYAENDKARCARIIAALAGKPPEQRHAKFIACIAILTAGENPVFVFGRKHGYVAEAPRGENGFGYDPIFCSVPNGPTWGEMAADEKNADSHRRRALDLVIQYLTGVVKGNTQYLSSENRLL